jgi:hypothetical protein
MTNDHELEAALGRLMAPGTADAEKVGRIVRHFDFIALPPQQHSFAWWPAALTDWNFAPAWPRVAALACAAVLGVTVGLSGIGARLAADLDLVRVASSDDAGSNAFDVDAVTGIRP